MSKESTPDCPNGVMDEIIEHVNSSTTAEVGGVLVGSATKGGVAITAAIPAHKATSGTTNVTFTHEVWEEVLPILDNDHPGKDIVGWYHSHPGFGVFLSEYDLFIHRNFFMDEKMVALVVDPLKGEGGWFGWKGEDIQQVSTIETPKVASSAAQKQELEHHRSRRRGNIAVAIAATALGAIIGGYLLGSSLTQPATDNAELVAENARLRTALEPSTNPADTTGPSAPAPPPPTGTLSACTYEYVVSSGDSYWAVAERLLGDGASWQSLALIDEQGVVVGLEPGDTLRIPATNCEESSADEGDVP
jgi:proteasome lid subunit RPN8/RPN11